MSQFFVLGAADPEMVAIESLLTASGQRFGHACLAGVRVHPGNAYKADGILFIDGSPATAGDTLVFVECDLVRIPSCWTPCESCGDHPDPAFVGLGLQDMGSPGGMGMCGDLHRWHQPAVVRVDHHRLGDPGYGLPPERYAEAASIAQLRALLHSGNFATVSELDAACPDWRLIAAADHCLAAAYRGLCPGVDPDALMDWRARSRAEFQRRPVEDVLADVEATRKVLRDAPSMIIGSDYDIITPGFDNEESSKHWYDITAKDMRGLAKVPELPEASAREGICFVADGLPDRDGRVKVVCQSGSEQQIAAFMETWAVEHGLTDIYGDPARGFAGGYT